MKCPNCGGPTGVDDTVHVQADNEVYRQRICKVCNHLFYTAEFVVERTEQFKQVWRDNHRLSFSTSESKKHKPYSEEEIQYMQEHMMDDYKAVAEHLGRSPESVRQRLRTYKKQLELRSARAIRVKGVSLKGNDVIYFDALMDAEKRGFNIGKISECINGKRFSHKGYRWERCK